MADRVGQQFGKYRLLRLLGKGGFAEVYLAGHVERGTQVALKVLHAVLMSGDVERFRSEAQIIASLAHPHIVRLLDFDAEQGTPFLVMEYASNGSLRERYPRGTALSVEQTLTYVRQVADALQYAHDQRLIHRDIKPENILLGPGDRVLLTDFGIATVAKSSHSQSTQEAMGTVTYMAPEQIQGKPRPASDQYALGIVAYEWLTGEPPFEGSFTEIATQHLFAAPASLRQKVPTIPEAVELVVLRALAKDPHQRFPSVGAFADALEQASRGSAPIYFAPTQVTPPLPLPTFTEAASVAPRPPQPMSAPTPFPPTIAGGAGGGPPFPAVPFPSTAVPAKSGLGLRLLVPIILAVVLLVVGGVAGAAYIAGHAQSGNALGLQSASDTSTPTDTPIFAPTPTDMPTPTDTPTDTPTPTPPPLPNVFNDSLLNGNVNGWYTDSHCYFSSDGYHMNTLTISTGYHCGAPFRQVDEADVSVEVKQIGGEIGYGFGIAFHLNGGDHYDFSVTSNGQWFVSKWTGNTYTYTVPATSNPVINTGLGATNLLEVRYQGSHFDFFINGTNVGSADDSDFSSGFVGLATSVSTEVVFTYFQITT